LTTVPNSGMIAKIQCVVPYGHRDRIELYCTTDLESEEQR
jgi:hypothetical protein